MDLRTGEIKEFSEEEFEKAKEDFKHMIEITEKEMTEKQKLEKQVSLKDHKSNLGKLLTKKRKELGYSKMSKNQKRNIRKKLKKRR